MTTEIISGRCEGCEERCDDIWGNGLCDMCNDQRMDRQELDESKRHPQVEGSKKTPTTGREKLLRIDELIRKAGV
jgi:hypothetical protein